MTVSPKTVVTTYFANVYATDTDTDNVTAHEIDRTQLTTTINDTQYNFVHGHRNDMINNIIVQILFCLVYLCIFVLGLFGNVLVCYVVLRNRAMQTVTNLFITNLALSDILLCALAVPFTPLYTFLERWIFGTALCHLVPYAQGCSVYISTLTLTSIAIDRFFVIIYPFHPRMKLSTCVLIVIGIWTFSLMVTLPYGIYMTLKEHAIGHNTTNSYCEEHWPSEEYRKVFGSLTSMLQFLFPFIIISFCYICVSVKLNDRAKSKPGAKTGRREEVDRERKRRTNRMLIAMVAVFGISWLPINLINIRNDFDATATEWEYTNFLFFIAHFIAMSSTCYNPFLYAWLNDNFRKEFKQVLPYFGYPFRRRNQIGGYGGGGGNGASSAGGCGGGSGGGGGGGRGRGGICGIGDSRLRSERTFNGNNETVQESLLPSSIMRTTSHFGETTQQEILDDEKPMQQQQQQQSSFNNFESILLSDVMPPLISSHETIILPTSAVNETPFEGSANRLAATIVGEPLSTDCSQVAFILSKTDGGGDGGGGKIL